MSAQIRSVQNAEHYEWGNNCDGWHLLRDKNLSVISERIPAGGSERLHFHHHAQQLFYILKGEATFEIDGNSMRLMQHDSIHVLPGSKHLIANHATDDLLFLV